MTRQPPSDPIPDIVEIPQITAAILRLAEITQAALAGLESPEQTHDSLEDLMNDVLRIQDRLA